jgi:hemoglobin/transferrin/lactoferrin receptor protein
MFGEIGRRLGRRLTVACVLAGLWVPTLAAQDGMAIEGTVRDAASGAALSGVQIAAEGRGVLSDRAGRFRLAVSSGDALVTFQRLGYETVRVVAAEMDAVVTLSIRPVLLDGLVVDGGAVHHLAVGTALTVASASGESLAARGATSVAESLAGMEGVSVARPAAWGARASLRGLGGERVAVMVDGNRVNRACSGGMDQGLSTIDPATVERVEILTGPGSTLYGSGNVGGVINVVTRRGEGAPGLSGEVRASASSAVPGGATGATLRTGRDAWSMTASVDGAAYGDYRDATHVVEGTGFRQGTADLKLEVTPAAAHRTQLQVQAFEGWDIGWPGAPGHEMAIPRQRRHMLSLDHGWQRDGSVLDAVSLRGFVQHLDHHMSMRMDGHHHGGHDPGGDDHRGYAHTMDDHHHPSGQQVTVTDARSTSTTSAARLQGRLLPGSHSHLDVGAEVTRWAADGTRWSGVDGDGHGTELRTWPDVHITDAGLFAQGEVRPSSAIALTGGLRLDRVTRRAEAVPATAEWVRTGNVGLRADLGRGFDLRSGAGIGYRIPDPTELFELAARPDGFLYRGNPELSTETGRNLEASLAYAGDVADASVTVFRNDLRNLIAPAHAGDEMMAGRPVLTYRNHARARLAGITGRAVFSVFDRTDLRSTVSYVRGTDPHTGLPLPQVPPLEGSVILRHLPDTGPAWVELEARGASTQHRVAPDAPETVTPAWGVLDLRTGFDLAGSAITVGIGNVLNADYRTHLDPQAIHQPGRNLFVRATRRF